MGPVEMLIEASVFIAVIVGIVFLLYPFARRLGGGNAAHREELLSAIRDLQDQVVDVSRRLESMERRLPPARDAGESE